MVFALNANVDSNLIAIENVESNAMTKTVLIVLIHRHVEHVNKDERCADCIDPWTCRAFKEGFKFADTGKCKRISSDKNCAECPDDAYVCT